MPSPLGRVNRAEPSTPLGSRAHLRHEAVGGTFPFFPRYASVAHCLMHDIDEGHGETVLFLHGDPTWGYLWRKLVPPVSVTHQCIAPDHMGMGKSSARLMEARYHVNRRRSFVS